MAVDRVAIVEAALDAALADVAGPPVPPLAPDAPLVTGSSLTASRAVELFVDQVTSRSLDVAARRLKAEGVAYYTIASAGHEDDAVLGALLRPTDPCFLHYRSGGLMAARSRQVPGADVVRDTLLSLCAAADDPASGGRHKVWGSPDGWVIPQTSTIASHLPKAVGAAVTLGRAGRYGHELPVPTDSIVACSFGDASVNHATALTAINAARWARRRGEAVPLLLVCEDNGLGISVPTPARWVSDTFGDLPGLHLVHASGELTDVWEAASAAVERCRERRSPVLLHLETVRLWGHAGSDVELAYRAPAQIEAAEARDPIVRTARQLLRTGAASPAQLRGLVAEVRARVDELAPEAAAAPRLTTLAAVTAPLAPEGDDATRAARGAAIGDELRRASFGGTLPEEATAPARRTLAAHLGAALHDELLRRPEVTVFGEDVGPKGGVYGVTRGLQERFGQERVFDTLLDETSILGLAQGAGLLGRLPVPEIQYLAYLHNALDQLRGEACSTSFFSAGRFRTPMVVRIAGLGYQRGFGGHFHNDDAVGALRDIPGLVLAVPSRGDDAARMLRGALALAAAHGRVVALLEPIALYHERDLYEPGDGAWLSDYPDPGRILLPGEVAVYGPDADDVLLVTYGNGVRLALRAARRLAEDGIACRTLDLRWLNPLPTAAIATHADACGAVVVVDECRATGGGIADAVVAHLAERGTAGPLRSVRSHDSYVPIGPAADLVLVSEEDVIAAVRMLPRRGPTGT
ncbi:MAG: thiamine pyrophosphate-dependent enzyme [Nitriliruptor sp.]